MRDPLYKHQRCTFQGLPGDPIYRVTILMDEHDGKVLAYFEDLGHTREVLASILTPANDELKVIQ